MNFAKPFMFIAVLTVCFFTMPFAMAADTGMDTFKALLVKGDLAAAQTWVDQNPQQTVAAELALLAMASGELPKDAALAQLHMTMASNLAAAVDAANASKVGDSTKKFVQSVLDGTPHPGSAPNGDAIDPQAGIALLNSALTIAQSKTVAENNPELATWIEAQLQQYSDENDVLFAQIPNGNPQTQGGVQRFVTPSTGSGASAF